MNMWQLFSAWNWDPLVLAGSTALAGGYAWAARPRWSRQALCFAAGMLVLLLTLLSPLELLGSTYLLSAHMVQHILLTQVVAPLLLVGLPAGLAARALQHPLLGRLEHHLGHPVVAWLAGVGMLWLWHAPALYNAALAHPLLFDLQHACVLLAALVFWWPIFAPLPSARLAALPGIFYLFSACLASSVLGMVITFAPLSLYPAYLQPHDMLGLLPFLRGTCGLTPGVDQQFGGLLMWVPCCLFYLTAIMTVYARWQNSATAPRMHAAEERL